MDKYLLFYIIILQCKLLLLYKNEKSVNYFYII